MLELVQRLFDEGRPTPVEPPPHESIAAEPVESVDAGLVAAEPVGAPRVAAERAAVRRTRAKLPDELRREAARLCRQLRALQQATRR